MRPGHDVRAHARGGRARPLAGVAALALVALAPAACEQSKGELGRDTANIASDTAVIRDAQAAVNEVLRNADDCDAAKAALPEASRKLDEATGRVRTPGGRATLDGLKAQVANVARNCP